MVLWLAWAEMIAQPHYFKHYQVEQGLSNNAVICIIQDSKGFMWFGTRDGLNRFDGYTFKSFRHDTYDNNSLGNNFVHSLYEDRDGMIWTGTDQGIYVYDPRNDRFSHFPYQQNKEVLLIVGDDKDNIWFLGDFDLYCFNRKSKSLQEFGELGFHGLRGILVHNDVVWGGSVDGKLIKYDSGTNKKKVFDLFDHSAPAISKSVTTMAIDSNGSRLLIGTSSQGLKAFHIMKETYRDVLTSTSTGEPLFVRDIKQIGKDYWLASEAGVFVLSDIETSAYQRLQQQHGNPWAISDNAVYAIWEDVESGIWIGTWFGGINYYHPQHDFFEKFFPIAGKPSISGNAVREITSDRNGTLWIGTENGGLNRFNPQDNSFKSYLPTNDKQAIGSYNLHGLTVLGDTLLIGTFEQGLEMFNISTEKVFRKFYAKGGDNGLHSNFVYTTLRRKNGEVLLATNFGVYMFRPETGSFEVVKAIPHHIFYTCLFEDTKGYIWAGTWRDGLYYYHPKTGEKGFFAAKNDGKGLPSNRVTYIQEDRQQTVWVGTEEGLCCYDATERVFRQINFKSLGKSLLVCAILEDDYGKLWVSTSNGLIQFDPQNGNSRLFTTAHGLLSNQFNYNAAYKSTDGTLYFGTVKGLVRFHPKKMPLKQVSAPIYITGMQVYNRELAIGPGKYDLKKSISYTDSLVLPYNRSTISIDFSTLSYISPERNEYAYKLEGLDQKWTHITANRKAYFTELPAGKYQFRVAAVNSAGKRLGPEKTLFLQILPAPWASPMARVFYFVLGVCLLTFFVRNYHRRQKEKHEIRLEQLAHRKEEEMYHAKIAFFTQVAHEIRTPLTLIKAPMEKVLKKVDEVPSIKKNLLIMQRNTERLLQLAGQLLDFRKTEIKGLQLNYQQVQLIPFLKQVLGGIRPTLTEAKLRLSYHLPKEEIVVCVDLDALDKMVSNLMSNAIKYAKSEVVLSLEQSTNCFLLRVSNDGELIPEEMSEKIFEPFFRTPAAYGTMGAGLGLALAKSLANMHGGKLYLETENRKEFNTFVLVLPITNIKA